MWPWVPVLGCRSFGPLACPFLCLVRPVGVFVVCLVSVVPASRVGCPLFVFWGSMETPPELTPPFSSWVVLIVGRSGGPGCTCCLCASPLRSSSPAKFICLCFFSVTSVPVQRWRSLSVLRVGVPTLGAAAVQRSWAVSPDQHVFEPVGDPQFGPKSAGGASVEGDQIYQFSGGSGDHPKRLRTSSRAF